MIKKKTSLFDLNIKKILEDWTISDAIREFISNAIDESKISTTRNPSIRMKGDNLIIEDYGRGLKVEHLSQNESLEKKNKSGVIGKFGIGLKDAIAVLYRHGIEFTIHTGSFEMKPVLEKKHGFKEKTIHMKITKKMKEISGTKIVIKKINTKIVNKAKENFLTFAKHKVMFENEYGQVIEKSKVSSIYVNGMKIAENDTYTFSYNIIKTNKKLDSKMNRERKSLGREAYSDLISKIIAANTSNEVLEVLMKNRESSGEMEKKEIRSIVFKVLNETNNYIFMTSEQLRSLPDGRKEDLFPLDKEFVIVKNCDEDLIRSLDLYDIEKGRLEYEENFNPEAIKNPELSSSEKIMVSMLEDLLSKLCKEKRIFIVKASHAYQKNLLGYWLSTEPDNIYLHRKVLSDKKLAIITLVHEYSHSINGHTDSSRGFESDLQDTWYYISTNKLI